MVQDVDEERGERQAWRAGVRNSMSYDPACHHWIHKRVYGIASEACHFCRGRVFLGCVRPRRASHVVLTGLNAGEYVR